MVRVSGLGTRTQEGDGRAYKARNFRVGWVRFVEAMVVDPDGEGRPGSDGGWNRGPEGLDVEEA